MNKMLNIAKIYKKQLENSEFLVLHPSNNGQATGSQSRKCWENWLLKLPERFLHLKEINAFDIVIIIFGIEGTKEKCYQDNMHYKNALHCLSDEKFYVNRNPVVFNIISVF